MHLNSKKVKQLLSLTTVLLSLIILEASQITIVLADVGEITRVSVDSNGNQGNGGSYHPEISANGRYVVFASGATNLVTGDTNGMRDVFLHDIQSGETTRVSVDSNGVQGNGASHDPSISADGRYIVFVSYANNLVIDDVNKTADIFLRDMLTNTTTRISVNSVGVQGNNSSDYPPSLSDDGRYIAFTSWSNNLVVGDTNGRPDAYIRDTKTNITTLVSVAMDGTFTDDGAHVTSMTPDGRYVVFYSESNELISEDTNGRTDVFRRDMYTNTTTRISVSSNGEQGNGGSGNGRTSADGRYISFGSSANNLVTGDTNGRTDVFLRDMYTNTTTRISVSSNGDQGNNFSYVGSLSADGRYILFMSDANNLVSGDSNGSSDIFMYDRQTNTTTLISQLPDGTQGNAESSSNSISADGHYIAFFSWANNFVADDTNGVPDIFFHENNIVLSGVFNKTSPPNAATGQTLSPMLSWEASAGATSYEYCYSSAAGPCTKWNSVGTNTSVTLSGLASNHTYYWQVRAVNADGTTEADGGTWWSFKTTTTPVCSWPPYTAPTAPTFGDVAMDAGHWSWVERLSNSGITAGCGSGNYCPFTEVVRAQMAIFLLRGKHCGSTYTPPAVGGSTGFGDVPLTASYAPWVKQLAAEGITAGCGGGNFCPLTVVNRAQMAIFLLRTKHGATYSPPDLGGSTGFADVPLDASYAPWVKQLAAEGITAGCGGGNFCPLTNVNRAQMATFLVRTFGLP